MESVNEIATAYVQFALAMDLHRHGYVDAYVGPSEWKDLVEKSGRRPLHELTHNVQELSTQLSGILEIDPQRKDYLSKELLAMETILRILQGDHLPLQKEVALVYGLEPEWTGEDEFLKFRQKLEDLLPSVGSLQGQIEKRKEAYFIPPSHIEELTIGIASELRNRTDRLFSLPEHESVEINLVRDKSWRAYNFYMGNCKSRIEINTDLPISIIDLVQLIAHEAYPGHHTEQCFKDTKLYRERGWVEHAIIVLNSPANAVSEAIATRALSTLMSDEELVEWMEQVLLPQTGIEPLAMKLELEISQIHFQLSSAVVRNAAFMLHDQGKSEEMVMDYFRRYALLDDAWIRKRIAFLKEPLYRSYTFNYHYGGKMLDALFEAKGDRTYWFNRLLNEPVTPNQIQHWIEK